MFLGNKRYKISMEDIKGARLSPSLQHIASTMNLESLIVLDQVHGSKGFFVDTSMFAKPFDLFSRQGDFLVTRLKRCGLVALTADCVPIILYDRVQEIIGIAHAGWRGSAQGVVVSALQAMQRAGSLSKNIEIIFAASAGACCYEVGFDFSKQFKQYAYARKAFIKRNNALYFDNKIFLEHQLKELGILPQNIYNKDVSCTICNINYCSFRREKDEADRQATVVALI